MRRICTVAICAVDKSRRCCAECLEPACDARCKNDPSRCRVWEYEKAEDPSRGWNRTLDWDEIWRLRKMGLQNQQIAERLGCSDSTVSNILAKMRRGGAQ